MAGKAFPSVGLTPSGRPVLRPDEIESSLISSVDLESDDQSLSSNFNFPRLKSGLLILTTHRLIWISETTSSASRSPSEAVYIPLASVTHIFAHKKSLKSMFATPRVRFQVRVSAEGCVAEESGGSVSSSVITIVMRGKGDLDVFISKFWEAWRGRAWESGVAQVGDKVGAVKERLDATISGGSGLMMAGVSGILRKEQEMWESTDKSLQDAFQDLNALMSKAKEMVMLAERMRQKLLSGSNTQSNSSNDEELGSKQEMQDWLLSVGIASPVTKESAGAMYHQQLSRQLADFVRIPLEKAGGVINLIDVYCLFNRARGTELISPEDLLRACSIWEKFDVPIMLRKFDSGVMVIQSKSYSDEEVFTKIKSMVQKPDALRAGISASDAAMTLGIAPAMAKEHLLNAESKGLLCRDISPDGFRFYINLFPEISQEDIYGVKDYGTYAMWVTATSVW
uniref:Vacuolar protein-sorting-associated protein 36 n=1 Tax=Kalanchoe fedtschenkoi TaxID=63787 RepID=A0A7N0T6J6_KALFE